MDMATSVIVEYMFYCLDPECDLLAGLSFVWMRLRRLSTKPYECSYSKSWSFSTPTRARSRCRQMPSMSVKRKIWSRGCHSEGPCWKQRFSAINYVHVKIYIYIFLSYWVSEFGCKGAKCSYLQLIQFVLHAMWVKCWWDLHEVSGLLIVIMIKR